MFMSHRLSRLDETQRENFKWGGGESEYAQKRRENETAEDSSSKYCSFRGLPLSFVPPPPHSLEGLLLLIILLPKPEWIPGSGPDERSAAELRRHRAVNRSKPMMLSDDPTPCRFDTVAHKEAQALAG